MFSSTLALATSALAPLTQVAEHTKSEFDLASRRTVSAQHVELPELAREIGCVSPAVLAVPERLKLGKESRSMIVNRMEVHLV